jgi:hypothetical protein
VTTAAAEQRSSAADGSEGDASSVRADAERARSTAWVEETAATLLAHVEIEPGQGLDDLALAMGTPAADLEEPIKRLLAENKITEELRQGQAAYYPT